MAPFFSAVQVVIEFARRVVVRGAVEPYLGRTRCRLLYGYNDLAWTVQQRELEVLRAPWRELEVRGAPLQLLRHGIAALQENLHLLEHGTKLFCCCLQVFAGGVLILGFARSSGC